MNKKSHKHECSHGARNDSILVIADSEMYILKPEWEKKGVGIYIYIYKQTYGDTQLSTNRQNIDICLSNYITAYMCTLIFFLLCVHVTLCTQEFLWMEMCVHM